MSWLDRASCRGPEARRLPWLDRDPPPTAVVRMEAICRVCAVFTECETHMRENDDKVGFRAGVLWTGGDKPEQSYRQRCFCACCGRRYIPRAHVTNSVYCSRGCAASGERRRKREGQ